MARSKSEERIKMTTEIKIGSQVSCPQTNDDSEISYVIGELTAINSRYATVEVDGKSIKVGKTKIEAIGSEAVAEGYELPELCPHCNIDYVDNGYQTHDSLTADGLPGLEKHEYVCLACDGEFGPLITPSNGINRIDRSNYIPCVAASGRASLDNGDAIALQLRGQTLEFAYEIASEHLDIPSASLKSKYAHLNPGQQRMCLGNRLRKLG